MRAKMNRAFTLVEILIVVVILGILAAVVIPQFVNASDEAQVGNVGLSSGRSAPRFSSSVPSRTPTTSRCWLRLMPTVRSPGSP